MDTTLTESGPFERVLTVRIPGAELTRAEDRAARRLAADVKIKGFRPGKAPRRLVEAAVGSERLRTEALEEVLPEVIESALSEAELVPATIPALTDTRDSEDGVEVDIKVTLWPTVDDLPDLAERPVEIESIEVTDEEVSQQIERLRHQFAELEETVRPATQGDYALIDINAMRGGSRIEEASASDLLYEVGSRSFIPGLDEPLEGASAGDIRKFVAELPAGFGDHGGLTAELQVLVKGVRTKKLPEVTDEWVGEVSEFGSIDELRSSLAEELGELKKAAGRAELRSKVMDALLQEVELELPDSLVGAEMESLLHSLLHRLESQGVGLETYLQTVGQDQEQLVADLRTQATRNLQVRILLDSVAAARDLEVEAEEVDEAIHRLAAAADRPVEEVRQAMVERNQVQALVGDILRQKALDAVVESAVPVDASGSPVVLFPEEATEEGDPTEVME